MASYKELIEQSFELPDNGLILREGSLHFNGIDLMSLIREHGSPLRITYLPKIRKQIQAARNWFEDAISDLNYSGSYHYCYCTKSSHFSHVLRETLAEGVGMEISSAFDVDLLERLYLQKELDKDHLILCNGFKSPLYVQRISKLINLGFDQVIPILDNQAEFEQLKETIIGDFQVGIRVASEEPPDFSVYTSRLGIRKDQIESTFEELIATEPRARLTMLHFFVAAGISDDMYYWSELSRMVSIYIDLKRKCPSLKYLNIGGGMPTRDHLGFDFNYAQTIRMIVELIRDQCEEAGVEAPDIVTEFGQYTVGESGAMFFSVLGEKKQNDRERWYMIDSSLMTNLPDIYGIGKRFLVLPVNKWDNEAVRVQIGGQSCDQLDFYNQSVNGDDVYMPELDYGEPLFIGFFNMGAYQEALSGYGGLKHCLLPAARHILINRNEQGELSVELFADEQLSANMLQTLGYQ